MTARPSPSYQLQLPDEVLEEVDGQVTSFWLDGEELVLQFSSYTRTDGAQVPAAQRMTERMIKVGGAWKRLDLKLCPGAEEAFSEQTDGDTTHLHGYLTWPHLAIYATIIGPTAQMQSLNSWAHNGLRTLRLTTQ